MTSSWWSGGRHHQQPRGNTEKFQEQNAGTIYLEPELRTWAVDIVL
jgi:hypothetical protein